MKQTSPTWKKIRLLSVVILVGIIATTIYFRVSQSFLQSTIDGQRETIRDLQNEIDAIESEPGYNKISLVRDMVRNTDVLPRSEHIPKVIQMLQDVQAIDSSSKDRIELSDFRVSLDEIELHGKVSRLLLLYFTSEEKGFTGLIDRFKQLEFIDNIRIQTYQKGEGGYEFILKGDVVLDS